MKNALLDLKIFAACHNLWGGPLGPRPTPPSARLLAAAMLLCGAGAFACQPRQGITGKMMWDGRAGVQYTRWLALMKSFAAAV
jgi:hypothetical protein